MTWCSGYRQPKLSPAGDATPRLRRAGERRGQERAGRLARVNGAPGLVIVEADGASVVSLTIDAGRIIAVDIVRNPDKLRGLGEVS